jgi:uracil-DNA glycosylase
MSLPNARVGRALPLHAPELATALDAHRAAMDACRRCALPPDVRPVVAEARAPRAMLVGQAPGKTEVAIRRPFAGRAGTTLFRWLDRAGLAERAVREHVYMTAVTRCFPGSHPSGRGDRVPSPRERAACSGWLDAELTIIRPKLVILVGRLAIDRFLGPLPLDELVGRTHEVAHCGGRSLALPLPHPSGASSWIHAPGHPELLTRALRLLRLAVLDLEVLPADLVHDPRAAQSVA